MTLISLPPYAFRPSNQVIADFGCGDAQIARTVKNKVYSFDLVAVNKHVTVCDMAKVSCFRLEEKNYLGP